MKLPILSKMADFNTSQVMGVTFEITTRWVPLRIGDSLIPNPRLLTRSQVYGTAGGWTGCRWSYMVCPEWYRFFSSWKKQEDNTINMVPLSSAEDQILHSVVAVRKVTKPFGSSILAKRALREIKLLRYLRHENVRTQFNPSNHQNFN
jgi:hypothetical protein